MRPLPALALAILLAPATTLADDASVVREIVFVGNDTTEPGTMLREMTVHVAEPADPEQVERSRQAIQDLGLFRSVEVSEVPVPGGVRLVFTVKEKYYLIPSPRADTNSDGQYSYGVQLRWYNAFGLNHTAKATLKYNNRQAAGRGTALEFDASYAVPFIDGTPYGVEVSSSHVTEPVEAPAPYDEVRDSARLLVSRSLARHIASQGWRVGAGLQWQRQKVSGDGAPPAQGTATALVLTAGFQDVRHNIYSEEGQRGGLEFVGTVDEHLSDYDYNTLTAEYDGSWYVGEAKHQSVALFAKAGA
ncbi:MAG TPA: POTRA domain-containing protein [Verrucomicrobiae bacterium]|nr:POTRA domain-containing protein [Verrucomicrobiae bacterium]